MRFVENIFCWGKFFPRFFCGSYVFSLFIVLFTTLRSNSSSCIMWYKTYINLRKTVRYSSFIVNSEKCFWAPDGNRWQREGHDVYWFVCDVRTAKSAVSICPYILLTNQYISWPSLCHLSPGSSMVRASHRRSEGCGFDSRLGLRNIFLSLR